MREHPTNGRAGMGRFVAVVGPSGAGKDTVMSRAAVHPDLPASVRFARRIITRPLRPDAEVHESVDDGAFDAGLATGAFALHWRAHGLRYALPATLHDDLACGRTVVANVSRGVLNLACDRFHAVHVVEIIADRDVLQSRLLSREREGPAEVAARLAREVALVVPDGARGHAAIDNSSDPASATDRFIQHLRALCASKPAPG